MADEIKDQLVEDGGQSTWSNYATKGPYYYPRGALGKFFARFFATPAQAAVVREIDGIEGREIEGDATFANSDIKRDDGGLAFTINRATPVYSEIERVRRTRYKDYEKMDEYPEVGAAFDIYADDCTQKDTQHRRWHIKSDSPQVVKEVSNLFESIELDRVYFDICRNVVKFGDCFTELIADVNEPERGIRKIKVLNPNYIIRVENDYGYLKTFLQQIPEKNSFEPSVPQMDETGTNTSKFI